MTYSSPSAIWYQNFHLILFHFWVDTVLNIILIFIDKCQRRKRLLFCWASVFSLLDICFIMNKDAFPFYLDIMMNLKMDKEINLTHDINNINCIPEILNDLTVSFFFHHNQHFLNTKHKMKTIQSFYFVNFNYVKIFTMKYNLILSYIKQKSVHLSFLFN